MASRPVFSPFGGAVAATLHTALVVGCAVMVARGMETSSDAAMVWCGFFVIDFPTSLLVVASDLWLGGVLQEMMGWDCYHVYVFALEFGVLGAVQHFFLMGWVTPVLWRIVRTAVDKIVSV